MIAVGNILFTDRVVLAMRDAFDTAANQPLAERLLIGLEAGRDAGGEISEPVRSSALRVTGKDGIDDWDLRIDNAAEAISALRDLKIAYGENAELLRAVALRPNQVPVARNLFRASVNQIEALGLEDRFPTTRRSQNWTLTG